MPTPQQIAQVQSNLRNMMALNDHIYSHTEARVVNAYQLLTLIDGDNSDPGLVVGLNIVEGAFWALATTPEGAFFASFVSGMLTWWTTPSNAPPSLNSTLANLELRLSDTVREIDSKLADFYQDVAANWNVSFNSNGTSYSLNELASLTIPAETDPQFEQWTGAALKGLEQQIWKTLMPAIYVVTQWINLLLSEDGTTDDNARKWAQDAIKQHPAYYYTWEFHKGTGSCGDNDRWEGTEFVLGTGITQYDDHAMNPDACKYLFIDDVGGNVINADGLFLRADVFTKLNLPTAMYNPVDSLGLGHTDAAARSFGFMRAAAKGRTLMQLVQTEGRASVEQRVIEKAQQDRVFANDLSRRPRQTLEAFLAVKIPEHLSISFIVEDQHTIGVIVPARA